MKNRIKLFSFILIFIFLLTACNASDIAPQPNGGGGNGDFELGNGSVDFGAGGEDVEQDLGRAAPSNNDAGNDAGSGVVVPDSTDADLDPETEDSDDVVESTGSDGLALLTEGQEIFGFAMPTENLIYALFEGETLNFQTNSDFQTMLDFTISSTLAGGLTEHESLTAILEGVASSMVFDGHENGKGVVIQITDIGEGIINVNIRFTGQWDTYDGGS